eukprot:CAMPEP_0195273746 /NCGR_PEP_ID=MMETSP0706-20130129/16695_1 /TAXON_ID=33640 /ORGANISM="Asterionellopsis glacialis, Strain CCMP134" /LENGTH=73 /DNA_ID=CAMNT_0040330399 /DNA_START=153 /DNA_END=370 /DNA_ORIENTATION=-
MRTSFHKHHLTIPASPLRGLVTFIFMLTTMEANIPEVSFLFLYANDEQDNLRMMLYYQNEQKRVSSSTVGHET